MGSLVEQCGRVAKSHGYRKKGLDLANLGCPLRPLVLGLLLLVAPSVAVAWTTSLDGTGAEAPGSLTDEGFSVVIDASGNVLSGGVLLEATEIAPLGGVAKFSGATGRVLWGPVFVEGSGVGSGLGPNSIAVDAAGDAIAVAGVDNVGTGIDGAVLKISGSTGAILWGPVFLSGSAVGGDDVLLTVALDAAGDVIVGGSFTNMGTGFDAAVVKLSGSTGAIVWGPVFVDGSAGLATDFDGAALVTLDSAGDVLVGATLINSATASDLSVVKLSGASGAVLWSTSIDGTGSLGAVFDGDNVSDLVVDGSGDVFAVGTLGNAGTTTDMAVVKLMGASGAVAWGPVSFDGTTIPPPGFSDGDGFSDVVLDGSGDVIVAGHLDNAGTASDTAVVKLSGGTGATLWGPVLLSGTAGEPTFDFAQAVDVDPSGDVIVAGIIHNAGTGQDLALAKLSGVSGGLLWQSSLDGTGAFVDYANSVAVDSTGDVVAVGTLNDVISDHDWSVVKVAGSTGTDFLLTCDGLAVDIAGTDGDDVINVAAEGFPNGAVVLAGDGRDTVYGSKGNDVICAGEDNDSVYAGDGDDIVLGEGGDDRLYGQAGLDTLRGGAGRDILDGGPDDDGVFGDGGDDTLRGGSGDDDLEGGDDVDKLFGGSGNDCLDAGPEPGEKCYGQAGTDGGSGCDTEFSIEGNPICGF